MQGTVLWVCDAKWYNEAYNPNVGSVGLHHERASIFSKDQEGRIWLFEQRYTKKSIVFSSISSSSTPTSSLILEDNDTVATI